MITLRKEAEIQKQIAKRYLNKLFGISEGQGNGSVEIIVDCIVNAAVLEATAAFVKGSEGEKRNG